MEGSKMTEYFVIAVDVCQECNGDGVIQHPAWVRYWERFPPGPQGNGMTVEQIDIVFIYDRDVEWFREQGYRCPGGRLPDEELPCAECDGAGKVRKEVPLREALEALTREDMRETERC